MSGADAEPLLDLLRRFIGQEVTIVALWNLDHQSQWNRTQYQYETIKDVTADYMDETWGKIVCHTESGQFKIALSLSNVVATCGDTWIAFCSSSDFGPFAIIAGRVVPDLNKYRTLLGILDESRAIRAFIEDMVR